MLALQEIIVAIRKKYALIPNANATERIKTADSMSSRKDPQQENMRRYMESVRAKSMSKYQKLIYEWTNDTAHFTFEQPHDFTVFELCEKGFKLLQDETIGSIQAVFPSLDRKTRKPKTCYTCYGEITSPFLVYKAFGAADVTHLLIAMSCKCERLVTLDKGFRELIPWSAPRLQIDVLEPSAMSAQ